MSSALDFTRLNLQHLACTLDAVGIGWIRLNRPPANALNVATLDELGLAVRAARFDRRVKVAALGSAVPGYFSSGLDLAEMETPEPERLELLDHLFKDLVVRPIRTGRKLFVAVVEGHCLGGGFELALAADLRIGVAGAWKLGLPEVRLGGMPGGGGIQLLARLIGRPTTLRVAMRGETLEPSRAAELGILDALFEGEHASAEASTYLKQLAQGPRDAYAAIKLAVQEGLELSPDQGMLFERELYRGLYASPDLAEGLKAFREKRRPRFGSD
jgi:enoyl-CoA hydratase